MVLRDDVLVKSNRGLSDCYQSTVVMKPFALKTEVLCKSEDLKAKLSLLKKKSVHCSPLFFIFISAHFERLMSYQNDPEALAAPEFLE